ncbi:MAG: nucleotidyltransferase domain-containing protein [Qipengyuania sp.]|nr:nucleotidyltransferase domain-containing protein [Qipengyuania sp.]
MQPELARSGIAALYLFGSFARGDSRADSDIDLAFDVEPDSKFNLFDQASLQTMLEERLGRHVDFLARHAIHPDLKPKIERDLVRVF